LNRVRKRGQTEEMPIIINIIYFVSRSVGLLLLFLIKTTATGRTYGSTQSRIRTSFRLAAIAFNSRIKTDNSWTVKVDLRIVIYSYMIKIGMIW
jgi:hypothetical protein